MIVGNPEIDRLIDRWIAGDSGAAAEIYRRYFERVRRFALKLSRRDVDAEELAQEAMVAGLEGVRAGRRPDRFTGWILGVVKNLARRKFREGGRGSRLPEDVLLPEQDRRGPRTVMIREEMNALLKTMVDGLPADLQEVVRLRFEKGMGRGKIAEALGMSPEGVDKRFDRVFERMRANLSRHFTTLLLPQAVLPTRGAAAGFDRLRPSFREIYRLCEIEGLGVGEAARRLNLPVGTVAERLKFAREAMRNAPPV